MKNFKKSGFLGLVLKSTGIAERFHARRARIAAQLSARVGSRAQPSSRPCRTTPFRDPMTGICGDQDAAKPPTLHCESDGAAYAVDYFGRREYGLADF